jgi:hypothetical protein
MRIASPSLAMTTQNVYNNSVPPLKFFPKNGIAALFAFMALSMTCRGEVLVAPTNPNPDVAKNEAPSVDFQSEDTFIDVPDALRSKQFVQRAVLSSAIEQTSRFGTSRYFVNQTLGYDAIFQPANRGPFAKYDSGDITLSAGYISEGGHSVELGVALSAVSNIFIDYRYIVRPGTYKFWPFLGMGLGENVGDLDITTPTPAAAAYYGGSTMFFGTLGLLIPLVDVGLKAEAKFEFYGMSRLVLSTSVGVNFFL